MHVLRPLYVFLGLIGVLLLIRTFYVPSDFGIHARGYMYGWHRKSNEEEWKQVRVKYQGKDFCKDCHHDRYSSLIKSPHAIIQCENCHGPAIEHPQEPPKLIIDRSRDLCLRCHTYLNYPTSNRRNINGINPDTHNPGIECSMCHNPHEPQLRSK